MPNDPWQALDARIHPPYTGFGSEWFMQVHLPDGPEIWDDHKAGQLLIHGANLPDLLEMGHLLISLLGWRGTLTLIDGRNSEAESAAVLGYMTFQPLDPHTYLSCDVLEGVFGAAAEAFRNKEAFSVVPRAVDAYRRETMRLGGIEPPADDTDDEEMDLDTKEKNALEEIDRDRNQDNAPYEGRGPQMLTGEANADDSEASNCQCCGVPADSPLRPQGDNISSATHRGGKNPAYYEDDGFTPKVRESLHSYEKDDGTKVISFDQRYNDLVKMAEWIEDKTNIGGHLAANLIFSIHELCMDSGTTYKSVSEIEVSPDGTLTQLFVDDHEHMTMVVSVEDFSSYLKRRK